MNLVDLGARSKFLTNLEFAELDCLAKKSGAELHGALSNTPYIYFILFVIIFIVVVYLIQKS
jgi:hypothetical protein